jgi:pimeloyl-ACP methyl ester carboxylesterase
MRKRFEYPPPVVQVTFATENVSATAVVVHGLWMTGSMLALQRRRLVQQGYRTLTFSYPSIRASLDEIASRLAALLRSLQGVPVHLIGHSLGGIVVLHLLGREPELKVGRVVLLGSPCAGSRTVAELMRSRAGRALLGKALTEWRPETGVAAAQRFEIGSIAGTMRLGMGRLLVSIPTPNDGVVCLHETQLPGFRDHVVLSVSHSGMLISSSVSRQIGHFLQHGRFIHA